MASKLPHNSEEDIVRKALEIHNPESRSAFLSNACSDDDELLRRVMALLEESRDGLGGDSYAAEPNSAESIGSTSIPKDRPAKTPQDEKAFATLGKYEVLEAIGKGGMGVVYRGFDPILRRKVALKVQAKSRGESGLARFKAEARAVATLDSHPNIVRIYELNVDHDPPFIAMEYIDGINLRELVRTYGPAAPKTAIDFMMAAAEGLQFAHDNGVIHRDVKPENIVLAPDNQVKVLDLGLAKLPLLDAESSTEKWNAITDSWVGGSVEFMSPEQSHSLADATVKSDVYSLGCTFYFLLTGELPFPGNDLGEMIQSHRTAERPSLLPHLGNSWQARQLDALVQQMMAIDPSKRTPDMHSVVSRLSEISDQIWLKQQRIRKWSLMTASGLLMLLAVWCVVRWLLPPTYDFTLDGVSDIAEVRALIQLQKEMGSLEKWDALYLANSRELARSIRRSPSAQSFKECVQNSDLPEIGSLMKALTLLDRHFNGQIPKLWRDMDEAKLVSELESVLRAMHTADKRERMGRFLSQPESKSTLRRWGIAEFPSPTLPSHQDRWIAEFNRAITQDVTPIADWYDTLLAFSEVEYSGSSGPDLILKLRTNEIVYRGYKTTANYEVWARYPFAGSKPSVGTADTSQLGEPNKSGESNQQVTELDTGVRLVDCLIMKEEGTSKPKLLWPPQEGVIDHARFVNFAHYLGIYDSYEIRNEKLSFAALASNLR